LVAGSKNYNLLLAASAKMAPVTTRTANAQMTRHKKTRRGLGKKQARVVSDVDMAVDEDSALTANNKEGIVSLLDPCSSSSQPLLSERPPSLTTAFPERPPTYTAGYSEVKTDPRIHVRKMAFAATTTY